MNKKIPLGISVGVTALVAAVAVLVTWFCSLRVFNNTLSTGEVADSVLADKMSELEQLVSANAYYSIDSTELQDETASGYVAGLNDPYAVYYTAEEYQKILDHNAGVLIGYGITVTKGEDGTLPVVGITANSPAEAAGIQVGDTVTAVDGEDLSSHTYDESTDLMTVTEAGETHTFTILRGEETLEFTLTSAEITLESATLTMDGEIGVITITSFTSNTASQVQAAVESAQEQGATGLLFDLRDNGGGTLEGVCDTLDYLLPAGTLFTSTLKDGTAYESKTSDASEITLPMTVLVNESTASAAELFAADLRDFGKAQVVGTTTYGKWVLQHTYTLSDGSALRLTIASFSSAAGNNYDGEGLTPDVTVDDDASTDEDEQLVKAKEVLRAAIAGE